MIAEVTIVKLVCKKGLSKLSDPKLFLGCSKRIFIHNNIESDPSEFSLFAGRLYKTWFVVSTYYVEDSDGLVFGFTGDVNLHPYIGDYFSTVEEYRDKKIDSILNEGNL